MTDIKQLSQWNTNTKYKNGDYILYNNKKYLCTLTHFSDNLSKPTFSPWSLDNSQPSPQPAPQPLPIYSDEQIIIILKASLEL